MFQQKSLLKPWGNIIWLWLAGYWWAKSFHGRKQWIDISSRGHWFCATKKLQQNFECKSLLKNLNIYYWYFLFYQLLNISIIIYPVWTLRSGVSTNMVAKISLIVELPLLSLFGGLKKCSAIVIRLLGVSIGTAKGDNPFPSSTLPVAIQTHMSIH